MLTEVGLETAMHKKTRTFSRGMKQRLGLADVLIKQPEVIILDEPTLGIDPAGVRDFLELIRQLNQRQWLTILLSSHHLHQVQQGLDEIYHQYFENNVKENVPNDKSNGFFQRSFFNRRQQR